MLKSQKIKKILIIAVPAVVVIIAAIIIIPMLIGPGFDVVKNSIYPIYDGEQVVISGNNNAKYLIDGKLDDGQISLDNSKAVLITDYDYENGGTLWFVTTSNSYKISDDVLAFRLADSGNGVLFFTDYDRKSEAATLILYDTKSKKQTKITEDAYYDESMICISPNGKSVGYASDYKSEDREFSGYIKVDGREPERLGKNYYAIAISDGGRHLYYARCINNFDDRAIYVRSGRNDSRLTTDWRRSIMLNRDYSQIIFQIEDKSYISVAGGDRIKIGSSLIDSFIMPQWAMSNYIYSDEGTSIDVLGTKNFANHVIRNSDGLAYLDSKYEVSKISSTSSNASSAIISDDGKTLLYINNNGHLSASDPTKPSSERREIGRDVRSFTATGDCKTIYYVNKDNELWFVKGVNPNNSAKVSDDVYSSYLSIPRGSKRVFFIFDYSSSSRSGELHFSNNGGKRTKVPGGDDVISIYVTATSVFYRTIDKIIYRSNGNEKFVNFVEIDN